MNERAVNESAVNERAVNESAVNESAVNESAVNESAVNESAVNERAVNRARWDERAERPCAPPALTRACLTPGYHATMPYFVRASEARAAFLS